ncbi:hypothetical protein SNEBB_003329 [Seison nebaliae]|nr:hypothetical protein SNEBB_003329 [Seison nebaliae]
MDSALDDTSKINSNEGTSKVNFANRDGTRSRSGSKKQSDLESGKKTGSKHKELQSKQSIRTKVGTNPHVVMMEINQLNKDIVRVNVIIDELKEKYKGRTPVHVYQDLQLKYTELENVCRSLERDYNKLYVNIVQNLKPSQDEVAKQRRENFEKKEAFGRANLTPRPDWNACGDWLDCGKTAWSIAINGRTSQEIIDILLSQFFREDAIDEPEYLKTYQPVKKTPAHLQTLFETVENEHLSIRDVYLIIEDIWELRSNTITPQKMNLDAFIHEYYNTVIPNKDERIRRLYNVHHTIMKNPQNSTLTEFLQIYTFKINESMHTSEEKVFKKLKKLIAELTNFNPEETNSTFMEEFRTELETVFYQRPTEMIDELINFITDRYKIIQQFDIIKRIKNGLKRDNLGEYGPFVALLRRQRNRSIEIYLEHLLKKQQGNTISGEDFMSRCKMMDPFITDEELMNQKTWLFARNRRKFNKQRRLLKLKKFKKVVMTYPLDFHPPNTNPYYDI